MARTSWHDRGIVRNIRLGEKGRSIIQISSYDPKKSYFGGIVDYGLRIKFANLDRNKLLGEEVAIDEKKGFGILGRKIYHEVSGRDFHYKGSDYVRTLKKEIMELVKNER